MEHSANAGTNEGFYVFGGMDNAMQVRRATSQTSRNGNTNWSGSSWSVFVFSFASAHQSFFALQNGIPIGLGANDDSTSIPNNDAVSTTLNIGERNDGASAQSSPDFAEIIFYNRPLWHFEISCINNYLKNRYAL